MGRLQHRGEARRVEDGSTLHALLAELAPDATVFHVVSWIPEQAEDEYVVLVDDRAVIALAVPRGRAGPAVEQVRQLPLATYRRGLRGQAAANLDLALSLAQECLRPS